MLEPFKNGAQWGDMLAMKEPVMRALVLAVDGMSMPGGEKAELVAAVYNEWLDHFDPEVDFSLPFWLKWAEHGIEETVDAAIVLALRYGVPALVELAVDWAHGTRAAT